MIAPSTIIVPAAKIATPLAFIRFLIISPLIAGVGMIIGLLMGTHLQNTVFSIFNFNKESSMNTVKNSIDTILPKGMFDKIMHNMPGWKKIIIPALSVLGLTAVSYYYIISRNAKLLQPKKKADELEGPKKVSQKEVGSQHELDSQNQESDDAAGLDKNKNISEVENPIIDQSNLISYEDGQIALGLAAAVGTLGIGASVALKMNSKSSSPESNKVVALGVASAAVLLGVGAAIIVKNGPNSQADQGIDSPICKDLPPAEDMSNPKNSMLSQGQEALSFYLEGLKPHILCMDDVSGEVSGRARSGSFNSDRSIASHSSVRSSHYRESPDANQRYMFKTSFNKPNKPEPSDLLGIKESITFDYYLAIYIDKDQDTQSNTFGYSVLHDKITLNTLHMDVHLLAFHFPFEQIWDKGLTHMIKNDLTQFIPQSNSEQFALVVSYSCLLSPKHEAILYNGVNGVNGVDKKKSTTFKQYKARWGNLDTDQKKDALKILSGDLKIFHQNADGFLVPDNFSDYEIDSGYGSYQGVSLGTVFEDL